MKIFDKISDKVFSEKINGVICWTLLGIAIALIAIQAVRGVGYVLITQP